MRQATGDGSAERNARLLAFREEYGARLDALAVRLLGSATDAHDLVQDVYAALMAATRNDPLALPPEELWGYARTVAVNLARSHFRRFDTRRVARVGHVPDRPGSEPDPGLAVLGIALAREVTAALGDLSEPERAAFLLRHYLGVPTQDAATMLRTTTSALKSAAHRARRKMRTRLKDFLGIGPLIVWRPARKGLATTFALPVTVTFLAGMALFGSAPDDRAGSFEALADRPGAVRAAALPATAGPTATVVRTVRGGQRQARRTSAETTEAGRRPAKVPPPCVRPVACVTDPGGADMKLVLPSMGPVPERELGLSSVALRAVCDESRVAQAALPNAPARCSPG